MNQYFVIKKYEVKNAKKVLFFFPAGFTKMWQYKWTISSLNRMGISVIGFDIAWKKTIKECDFNDFIQLVKKVDHVVAEIIQKNSKDIQYSVLGLSFGSVLSLYTAKQHKSIASIILFVPYGTLSHLLWTYKPTKPFIERLLNNGLKTERELEQLTHPVETQYNLGKLEGRKLVSFLGIKDKIVFDGEKLVVAIKKQNINATFYESRFGHFGTSVIGILRKSKWDHIL